MNKVYAFELKKGDVCYLSGRFVKVFHVKQPTPDCCYVVAKTAIGERWFHPGEILEVSS